MQSTEPAYTGASGRRLLKNRIKQAFEVLNDCTLCPRMCHVDRNAGETGICRTGKKAWLSSYNAHFGEEEPLVGSHGSGTIFFTHCNLLCSFCQNYDISHLGYGQKVSSDQLASIMLHLQTSGCHNINFVTPSHVVPQILSALDLAADKGLRVPLVYNSGGYDRVDTLALLEGIFDIYMPDFKFWDSDIAAATCDARDYPEVAREAVQEMHRQVGDLYLDDNGVALRGLLVRHLVLPNDLAGTRQVMRFISRRISSDTYVNVMSQYRPCGKADEIHLLAGKLSGEDYENAVQAAREEGLTRLDRPRKRFIIL
ncbi:radical SAM protein [Thermodesulfobacteriota bacterium]